MGIRDKINKHFSVNNLGFENLLEMVEQALDEQTFVKQSKKLLEGAKARQRSIRLPTIIPTETSVGQTPGSEEREQFEMWMGQMARGSQTPGDKISRIAEFLDPKVVQKNIEGASIPQALSYLMFLNSFVYMLKEFNASVAGFMWEPFLATIFGGKSRQVPTSEGDIADIRIEFGGKMSPISLKILNEVGDVKGSFTDLVGHFAAGGEEMRYVVVVKKQSGKGSISEVTFYEFNITADNFFEWIGNVAYVEKLKLVNQKFSLGQAGKKSWLKSGSRKKWGEEGNYVWVRHAVGGKQTRAGAMMGARPKWLPLAKIEKGEIIIIPDTAEQINLQGIPADGTLQLDTSLSFDRAEFEAGGAARSQTPGARVATTYEPVPGQDTKDTKVLWGSAEDLQNWSTMAAQATDKAAFFQEVLKSAPGAKGKQFHINAKHYSRKSQVLGKIRITVPSVNKVFESAATRIGEDMTLMFNSMAELSDNIGRFFLSDCGGQESSGACTEKDIAKRGSAGKTAIQNSKDLEKAVVKSVREMSGLEKSPDTARGSSWVSQRMKYKEE